MAYLRGKLIHNVGAASANERSPNVAELLRLVFTSDGVGVGVLSGVVRALMT